MWLSAAQLDRTLYTNEACQVVRGTAYPHCSQYSMVPLDRGAPLLLLPTAAQLCPLQLLLQLGDLAEEMEQKGQ